MIALSIKNIKRNLRRSILTALSLFVASFVVVFLYGYIQGFIKSIKIINIKLNSGHVTIAKKEYFEKQVFIPAYLYLNKKDIEEIEEKINKKTYVKAILKRTECGVMLINNAKDINENTLLLGIEQEKEENYLNLERKIIKGNYSLNKGIVIGTGLFKELGLMLNDSLILLTKSSMGRLTTIKLPIVGVFNLEYSNFDKNIAITSLTNVQRLLKMHGTTKILIFLKNEKYIKDFVSNFNIDPTIAAKSYKDNGDIILSLMDLASNVYFFIYIMIILLAAFAIINTMTIAVYERIREIGTLKAIGMTDMEVFTLFGIEGTIIGTIGGFLGSLFGWIFVCILAIKGINFESLFKDVSFPVPYIIKPEASIYVFFFAFALSIIISIIAALFPAIHTKKLLPQECLRSI